MRADLQALNERVDALRRFNRFYTRRIGLLNECLLDSTFSLTQARVLYELAHRNDLSAAQLSRELGLDPGYLSRMLRGFESRGLVKRARADADARRSLLALTRAGRAAYAPLERRSQQEGAATLAKLSQSRQRALCAGFDQVQRLLDPASADAAPDCVLRQHRPGDIGWVIHRHGALYAEEYGWDERFEALVAGICAKFIEHFDPSCERCWIAERDGRIVGSVFVVRRSKTVAKLRLMYVEPDVRGLGLGRRFVAEAIEFAREAGYRKMTLWTQSVLSAARRIYRSSGFRLVDSAPHHSFGHDLVGETWERSLARPAPAVPAAAARGKR
jgi:DNA-binding MarR family transcriptional regulator/N-acetylglutamate synthase-like GNAT family acetyltransferase